MSTLISGNDYTIYKRTATGPDVYKVFTCATDTSVSNTRDVTESKTKCGTKRSAGTLSWEMSFTGKVDIAPTSGTELSFDAVWADFIAGTLIHVAFQDAAGTVLQLHGDAIISKLDISAAVDNDVEFSMTLSGDGALTLT